MTFSCQTCNRPFGSSNALLQHQRDSRHIPSFNCNICDRSFGTIEALDQHTRDSPAHTPTFDCNACNRTFNSTEALEQHAQNSAVHAPSYDCNDCNRLFASMEALQQHTRDSPAHVPTFDCNTCNQSFGSLEALEQHSEILHFPTLHCGPCKRSFNSDSALAQHLQDSPNHQKNHKTPLDNFFGSFTGFKYDPSLPPTTSYAQLEQHQRWQRGDALSKGAWNRYQEALRDELEMWFGEEDDLTAWHSLCRAIGISPLPQTCRQCEHAVRRTHVNIVDLIDWGRKGQNEDERVDTFRTVGDLREYTRRTRKIFHNTFDQDEEGSNVVLRHLLRHIYRGSL